MHPQKSSAPVESDSPPPIETLTPRAYGRRRPGAPDPRLVKRPWERGEGKLRLHDWGDDPTATTEQDLTTAASTPATTTQKASRPRTVTQTETVTTAATDATTGAPTSVPAAPADDLPPATNTYMMSEPERRLYKSRDAFSSALDEFDAVCRQHATEMAAIRPALLEKFSKIPVIDTYRQAAIRCQKAKRTGQQCATGQSEASASTYSWSPRPRWPWPRSPPRRRSRAT
jgi:hypothetical protein